MRSSGWSDYGDTQRPMVKRWEGRADPNTLLTNILGQVYNSNEGPHKRQEQMLTLKDTPKHLKKATPPSFQLGLGILYSHIIGVTLSL